MCLQCITNASTYGKITEKYALMQSEREDDEWPIGHLGLVERNDPTLIFEVPPRNPYFYNMDFDYDDYEKEINEVYDAISEKNGKVPAKIKKMYSKELIDFCGYVYSNNLSLCVGDIFVLEDILNEFYYDFGLDSKLKLHNVYEKNLLFNVWFFGYMAEFVHTVEKLVEPHPFLIGELPRELTEDEQKENEEYYKILNDVYHSPTRHKEIFDLIFNKIKVNTHII